MKTGDKIEPPSNEEKLQVILKHIDLEVKEKGEYTGVREMRKHIAWYIKNLKNASSIRQKINKIENREQLGTCLIEYFKTL